MSLPPFIYQHGVHTIQYLYDLYGYEKLLQEIEVIHHIRRPSSVEPVIESKDEIKNVVIQPKEVSVDKKINTDPPSPPPTEIIKCAAMLSNGTPCGVRRKKSSEYCQRHHLLHQKSEQ